MTNAADKFRSWKIVCIRKYILSLKNYKKHHELKNR